VLCIFEYDDKFTGLLCFEEPENGIHPYRISATANLLKDLTSSFKNDEHSLRQVIVNTHSPILISKLTHWHQDMNVSVWFSKQNTLIKDINGIQTKLRVTRISPVVAMHDTLFRNENENKNKLTLAEVEKFLLTADAEEAIKILKS
jgi:AAA15 family ATPase/GTPase